MPRGPMTPQQRKARDDRFAARVRQVNVKGLLMHLGGKRVKRLGIELVHLHQNNTWALPNNPRDVFTTQNDALRAWIARHSRSYGPFRLVHDRHGWLLKWDQVELMKDVRRFVLKPSRQILAEAIRDARLRDPRPSKTRDHLGWRAWRWNVRENCLESPSQLTLWPDHTMVMKNAWNEADVVRGKSGIHACRLPRGDWRLARTPSDMPRGDIVGLVERFGKFVLGTEGWRAEWVMIKALLVPEEALAKEAKRVYPDVEVFVAPKGHWLRGETL